MLRIARQRAETPAADGPLREALAALHAATAEMARALGGMAHLVRGRAPSDASLGEGAGVWADDDYLYIEADLPEEIGTYLDVSTCGRMFLVRIARDADGKSSADKPLAVAAISVAASPAAP